MPIKYPREVKDRARVLYTQEGLSPDEIVAQLQIDLMNDQLPPNVVDVPKHRSSIYDWAKDYDWKPHWREAEKKRIEQRDAMEPFAISGITDPIWHLARVEAHRFAYGYAMAQPQAAIREVVRETILYVARTLAPGPRVYLELRPVIRDAVRGASVRAEHNPILEPNGIKPISSNSYACPQRWNS